MKREIEAAVTWLTNLLRARQDLSTTQLEDFKSALRSILEEKFQGHWYENPPWRGQGYRSIMSDGDVIDSVLLAAAKKANINDLVKRLPHEGFIMWIDFGDVEVRYNDSQMVELVYRNNGVDLGQDVNKPTAGGVSQQKRKDHSDDEGSSSSQQKIQKSADTTETAGPTEAPSGSKSTLNHQALPFFATVKQVYK